MNALYKISCLLLLMMAGACSLDRFPEAQLTDAGYWNNANDLRDAANYLYGVLPGMTDNNSGNMADDAYANTPNSISDATWQPPLQSTEWNNNYATIRAANNLLEKSVLVNDVQAAIDRYCAEAKFFRAWCYFDLVKRFRDVPLILRTFDVTDTLATAHRTPVELILDSVYADLDYAVLHLPSVPQLTAAEYGRVTNGAALALKARIALYAGTWNKFHGEGDAGKHLRIAVNACETLMGTQQYGLFTYNPVPDSSYLYLFRYEGEGAANRENILVKTYGNNVNNIILSHNYTAELNVGSATNATRALADAYLFTDGLPLDRSPLYQQPTSTLMEFENRDPRMDMTIFNRNHFYQTDLYRPGISNTFTGYRTRKYFVPVPEELVAKRSFIDHIILRYGEVLVTFAEAVFELNGAISDADLNRSVNLLRERARMPARLSNAFVDGNGLSMREEIRRERRVELAMESGHRYWDILRWKIAETELRRPVMGTKYFPAEHGNATSLNLATDGHVIMRPASARYFSAGRDYRWPLPTRDLGLNHNLVQNPNWN